MHDADLMRCKCTSNGFFKAAVYFIAITFSAEFVQIGGLFKKKTLLPHYKFLI